MRDVYEIEFKGETYIARFDEIEGIIVEGYDVEAEMMAEALSGEVGVGQLLGVLKYESLQKGEEAFPGLIKSWQRGSKKLTHFSLTSSVELAIAVIKSKKSLSSIALNPHAHFVTLATLARHENTEVRRSVAKNTSIRPELLAMLLKDREIRVRKSAMRNSKVKLETLEDKLLGSVTDRIGVANSPNISNDMIAKLSRDEAWQVRREIAKNRNIEIKILKSLALDPHPLVRKCVAANPNTPPKILHKLLLEKNILICTAVLRNPNTKNEDILEFVSTRNFPRDLFYEVHKFSLEVQKILLEKEAAKPVGRDSRSISRCLARRSKYREIQEYLLDKNIEEYNSALAANLHCCEDFKHIILNSRNSTSVELALSYQQTLDIPSQHKLAGSTTTMVRESLASKPNLSRRVITILAQDSNIGVLRTLVAFQRLSFQQLFRLAQEGLLTPVLSRTRNKSNRELYAKVEVAVFDKRPDLRDELALCARSQEGLNRLLALENKDIDKRLVSNNFLSESMRKKVKARIYGYSQAV